MNHTVSDATSAASVVDVRTAIRARGARSDDPGRAALILVGFAGATLAFTNLLYVTSVWLDTPYYDEWLSVPYAASAAQGQWSIWSIFDSGQGHTDIIYRLATILSAGFLRYDPRFSILLGIALYCGAATMLTAHYSSKASTHPRVFAAVAIAIWAAIFSLQNWENLLAAWLLNSAGTLFFMSVALILFKRTSMISFVGGLAAALACSFTFSNGLMIWPAAALLISLSGQRTRLIPLFICAAAMFGWFWVHHDQLGGKMNLGATPERLLAVLGAPLAFSHSIVSQDSKVSDASMLLAVSAGAGVIVLAIVATAVRTNLFRNFSAFAESRFSLAVLAYGFGSCAMIALGRSDLAASQALSSRYISTAFLPYMGLLFLFLDSLNSDGNTLRNWFIHIAGVAFSALVIASFIFAAQAEFQVGPYRRDFFQHWRQVVLNYKTVTDAQLADPNLPPAKIRAWAAEMDALHIGPFARQEGSRPPESTASLEPEIRGLDSGNWLVANRNLLIICPVGSQTVELPTYRPPDWPASKIIVESNAGLKPVNLDNTPITIPLENETVAVMISAADSKLSAPHPTATDNRQLVAIIQKVVCRK